jgi:hypothetical protein
MRASFRIKISEKTAAMRARWRLGVARNVQMTSAMTAMRAMPLVARCVYSMSAATVGCCWMTVPLQKGQCSPQPAPEPVARTAAPHRMTATL